MEITIRSGEHEVTVRDERPVLEPDVLAELLAAVAEHIDTSQGLSVQLPFGFTQVCSDDGPDDGQDSA